MDPRETALALYRFASDAGLTDATARTEGEEEGEGFEFELSLAYRHRSTAHMTIRRWPPDGPGGQRDAEVLYSGPPDWIAPDASARDPGAMEADPATRGGPSWAEAHRGEATEPAAEPMDDADPLASLRDDAFEPSDEVPIPPPRRPEPEPDARASDAPMKPPGPGIGREAGLRLADDCSGRCVVGDSAVIHAAECPHYAI